MFNENFDYLCQPAMNVMLFFEVSANFSFSDTLFVVDFNCCSEVKASVPGTSNKLGE